MPHLEQPITRWATIYEVFERQFRIAPGEALEPGIELFWTGHAGNYTCHIVPFPIFLTKRGLTNDFLLTTGPTFSDSLWTLFGLT
jgi:hypothetical protein